MSWDGIEYVASEGVESVGREGGGGGGGGGGVVRTQDSNLE